MFLKGLVQLRNVLERVNNILSVLFTFDMKCVWFSPFKWICVISLVFFEILREISVLSHAHIITDQYRDFVIFPGSEINHVCREHFLGIFFMIKLNL